jgi:hypothetical protein
MKERDVIEGVLRAFRKSPKFADSTLADLDTPDGPVTCPCPTVLLKKLKAVRIGRGCTIEYRGKKPGDNGDYHDFGVFVDDPMTDLVTPPREPGDDEPFAP